jgi:NADPH:quinone reductase-like Zn-dependent oxidoreductase
MAGKGRMRFKPAQGRQEQQMKALVATRYGGPEVVEWQDLPDPVAGPGEVIVRTIAATVVAPDMRMRGARFPRGFGLIARAMLGFGRLRHPVLGCEAAGVIDSVGPGVTAFAPGDAVIAYPAVGFRTGSHAERFAMKADGAIIAKPVALDWAQAAAFCHGGLTAVYFLRDRMGLQAGQRVLVAGAAGSVGHAAVQVARALGAVVVAGADTAHHAQFVAMGVNAVDLRTGRIDGRFDHVLDCTGTLHPRDAARLLLPGGRLGLAAADVPDMLGTLLRRDVVAGTFGGKVQDLRMLATLTTERAYRPAVDCVVTAAQGMRAHALAERRGRFGSVVLSFDPACAITAE